MSEEGWEARMAEKAAGRAVIQQAEQIARQDADDPHREHHTHLIGARVECSCGVYFGITTVAFDKDYDPTELFCSICGRRGVIDLPTD